VSGPAEPGRNEPENIFEVRSRPSGRFLGTVRASTPGEARRIAGDAFPGVRVHIVFSREIRFELTAKGKAAL
jgi:hypothetical protein